MLFVINFYYNSGSFLLKGKFVLKDIFFDIFVREFLYFELFVVNINGNKIYNFDVFL